MDSGCGLVAGYTPLLADSDWKYVGKDGRFGDGNATIFWHRPKDSSTYRVIYADLSVRDVAPEDPPK